MLLARTIKTPANDATSIWRSSHSIVHYFARRMSGLNQSFSLQTVHEYADVTAYMVIVRISRFVATGYSCANKTESGFRCRKTSVVIANRCCRESCKVCRSSPSAEHVSRKWSGAGRKSGERERAASCIMKT